MCINYTGLTESHRCINYIGFLITQIQPLIIPATHAKHIDHHKGTQHAVSLLITQVHSLRYRCSPQRYTAYRLIAHQRYKAYSVTAHHMHSDYNNTAHHRHTHTDSLLTTGVYSQQCHCSPEA